MPVTTFLLLRTFSFFGTHDSTFSQFSYLIDFSIQLSLPNLLPPPAVETVPSFCPQPHYSHYVLLQPDLTSSHGFPISVSSPGLSRALDEHFSWIQVSSTKMFHLKCQIYQTHHYTSHPQFVHCPLIHLYTCVRTHNSPWNQTLC